MACFVYNLVSSFPVVVLYTAVPKKLISLYESFQSNLIDGWTSPIRCLNSHSLYYIYIYIYIYIWYVYTLHVYNIYNTAIRIFINIYKDI